jgi:hypothetical protein
MLNTPVVRPFQMKIDDHRVVCKRLMPSLKFQTFESFKGLLSYRCRSAGPASTSN